MAVYKRRIFLINPKFQYRVTLFIVIFALIATAIYPFIISDLFEKMAAISPEKADSLRYAKRELLQVLLLIEAVILGFLFIFSIFLTHKMAGPMYKLKEHLKAIRQGGEIKHVFFRKGDYFQDVADEVNLTLEHFDMQREEDFESLQEISSYIANLALVVPEDKKPVLGEIQAKLAEIRTRNKSI